jgi:hypothetical protein
MSNASGKKIPRALRFCRLQLPRQQPPLSLVCEKMRNELRAP